MRKTNVVLTGLLGIAVLFSCKEDPHSNAKGSSKKDSSKTDALIGGAGQNVPEAYREGAELITRNDCLTCHKVADTSVGPSFQSIANRYDNMEANVTKLLVSVQKGSRNIWAGNAMTPHPNLTPDDGAKMIRYILSNRTKP